MPRRPKDEQELQKREAVGIIRASRFVRNYARSHKPIDFDTICLVHKEIFRVAWPEIAGKYREENLKIKGSKLLLPHFTDVLGLIRKVDKTFKEKLLSLEKVEGKLLDVGSPLEDQIKSIEEIVHVAAWIHHQITYIHPFREGNGRTARLAANLILERYGLVGISIKIEKENKNRYCAALSQIDQINDYEPLVKIIYEGLQDRYKGVSVKYYDFKE